MVSVSGERESVDGISHEERESQLMVSAMRRERVS